MQFVSVGDNSMVVEPTVTMRPAPKRKAHSLTGRITLPLLAAAFKAVKANRGVAGVDKVSIKMFEANLAQNLHALMRQLKDGSFEPYPLRRVFIPKNETEFRPLGIPAVRDRVAQEVVRRLLEPIFEPLFHEASYGFRPGRNCHQALAAALSLHDQGHEVVLDADIKGFFDNLPLRVIMQAVAAEVADGNILRLVEKFLRSGVMENGRFKPTTLGTPQGGVISPLLANIVLNHLDWQLHDAGFRFVRYADNFVVLCLTQTQAQEALTKVQTVLGELGLSLSPEKTRITTYRKGYAFLGFVLSRCIPADAPKVSQEIQRPGAGVHPPKAQLRPPCRRETQPAHPGHRTLLWHLVEHEPRTVQPTRFVGQDAATLYEIQAQVPSRQPQAAH